MSRKRTNAKSGKRSAKTQSKPKPQQNLPLPRPPPLRRQTASAIPLVCGLTDPFCDHSIGAKYFDSNGAKSLAYPQRTTFAIATDAAGQGSVLILPNYNNEWNYNPSSIVLPNVGFGLAGTASTLIANTANYRVVSWGMRIHNVATPLNSSGMVYVRGFSSQLGGSYINVNAVGYNCDVIANIPLQDCHDVAIIGKKANNTSAFYTAPSMTCHAGSTPSDWAGPGWDAYTITVVGGPVSSTPLVVELIKNFEIVIDDFDATAQLMTPAPRDNPTVARASEIVTSTAKSVFIEGAAAASSYVKRLATSAIASYFGGPAAGRATAMLVD